MRYQRTIIMLLVLAILAIGLAPVAAQDVGGVANQDDGVCPPTANPTLGVGVWIFPVTGDGRLFENDPWDPRGVQLVMWRNSAMLITAGPVCHQGNRYWRVQSRDGTYTFWAQESYQGTQLVQTVDGTSGGAVTQQADGACPVDLATNLQIGAVVTPAWADTRVYPDGPWITDNYYSWWTGKFVIDDGPRCHEGYRYWHVTNLDNSFGGWVMERYQGNTVLQRVFEQIQSTTPGVDYDTELVIAQPQPGNVLIIPPGVDNNVRLDGVGWIRIINNSIYAVCRIEVDGYNYLPPEYQPVRPGEISIDLGIPPGNQNVVIKTCDGQNLHNTSYTIEVAKTTEIVLTNGASAANTAITADGDCSKTPRTNFSAGQYARVIWGHDYLVPLHEAGSYNARIMTYLSEGQGFTILGDSTCDGGSQFWFVQTDDGTYGWIPSALSLGGSMYTVVIETVGTASGGVAPEQNSAPPPVVVEPPVAVCSLTVTNSSGYNFTNYWVTGGGDWGSPLGPLAAGASTSFPCDFQLYYDCMGVSHDNIYYRDPNGNIPGGGDCNISQRWQ